MYVCVRTRKTLTNYMRHIICLLLFFLLSIPVAGKWQYSISNFSKKNIKRLTKTGK